MIAKDKKTDVDDREFESFVTSISNNTTNKTLCPECGGVCNIIDNRYVSSLTTPKNELPPELTELLRATWKEYYRGVKKNTKPNVQQNRKKPGPNDIPEIGSQWTHKNNVYQVIRITNSTCHRPEYPVSIAYMNVSSRSTFSRPLEDWLETMEFVSHPDC